VPAGTTAEQALKDAGVPLKGPDGAVVVRDLATGELRDLAWAPGADAEVEPVPAASPEGRRGDPALHRARAGPGRAGPLPGTRLGIGPPVENGFYYDFAPERPFTPEDLQALEKRMQEIVKAGQYFSRREISDADAQAELAHEPFKLGADRPQGWHASDPASRREGADVEVGGAQLTMYDNLDRAPASGSGPTCAAGPHRAADQRDPGLLADPQRRAYWRGSEKNPQLPGLRHRVGEQGSAEGLPGSRWPRPSGATTAGWERSWTCSPFPDEIGSGLAVFTPGAASSGRELEDSAGGGTRSRTTRSSTPRTSARHGCSRSRSPRLVRRGHVPPMQLDEERDAEGTCAGRGRTTTSSR
jgi:threonyl-tRNA synthetase